MKKIIALLIVILIIISCGKDDFINVIEIPEFSFPTTIVFKDSLSAYDIFEGTPSNLIPTQGFELIELSSVLFTDYAYKQRLVKLPSGTKMSKTLDQNIDFPNGTILTKTFYYYIDERDTSLGKRIIETRLEIKENDVWNLATYVWNQQQNEAILQLDGADTPISWIDEKGDNRSINYHVPTENECMTCHQSNAQTAPLGPTLLNLNRNVSRNGNTINQIEHLQAIGLLNDVSISQIDVMVDYNDLNAPLSDKGRAYLNMNCAHCHNPNAWERSASRDFDFRYGTPYNETGIQFEKEKIKRVLQGLEMPLIGTTTLDEEGVSLIIDYLNNL